MILFSEEKKNEFKRINNNLKEINSILKSEFFGIDEQIDEIFNNIQSWLHFPELQNRPLVINLWGMTGCGKTSLINRLFELLELKSHYFYFNFAEIFDKSTYEIEQLLNETLKIGEIKTPVFVYDEFQYARTIKNNGGEVNNSAMKIFWELLDSGKFSQKHDYYTKRTLIQLQKITSKMVSNPNIVIKNGEVIDGYDEWLKILYDNDLEIYNLITNTKTDKVKINLDEMLDMDLNTIYKTNINAPNNIDKLIPSNRIEKISYTLNLSFGYSDDNSFEVIVEKIKTMDKYQLNDYITYIKDLVLTDIETDFSKSIIFVLGNLDEAYKISNDINPDMSADQFHNITKKLSTIDIKSALQKRFHNEQIARLGNIHLIYPAFSSETYHKIINKELKLFSDNIYNEYGLHFTCDKSINDIIYKDSVFPSQGTRPVFSTIYELVKSILPKILLNALEKDIKFSNIKYKFENNKFIIEYIFEDKVVDNIIIPQNLRVEKHRQKRNNNKQALTAVHEVGHIITNYKLFGKLPDKAYSITVDNESNGFVLYEIDDDEIFNKNNLKNYVATLLGGRAAEELIFGEGNVSNGASDDLNKANVIVNSAIRRWGLGDSLTINGWMSDEFGSDNKIKDDGTSDKKIEEIIEDSYKLAFDILTLSKPLVIILSKHLSERGSMTKEDLKTIIDEHMVLINENNVSKKQSKFYLNVLNDNFNKLDSKFFIKRT